MSLSQITGTAHGGHFAACPTQIQHISTGRQHSRIYTAYPIQTPTQHRYRIQQNLLCWTYTSAGTKAISLSECAPESSSQTFSISPQLTTNPDGTTSTSSFMILRFPGLVNTCVGSALYSASTRRRSLLDFPMNVLVNSQTCNTSSTDQQYYLQQISSPGECFVKESAQWGSSDLFGVEF